MKTGSIYMHVFPNGKAYIGKTIQPLHKRIGKDFAGYSGQRVLWHAIQKYGAANIRTEILYANIPESELNRLETLCIYRWNTCIEGNGYNVCSGGMGFDSASASELANTRVKNGTHNFQDPVFIEQQSIHRKERALKQWQDPEFRQKQSDRHKQKWQDPEFRQKQREGQCRRYKDPAEREKTSERFRKLWRTPEHRQFIIEGQCRRYKDPAEREKTGEASRKSWQNPKRRQKYHTTVERNFRIRMGMTKQQFIEVVDYFTCQRGWSLRRTANIFKVSKETIRRYKKEQKRSENSRQLLIKF